MNKNVKTTLFAVLFLTIISPFVYLFSNMYRGCGEYGGFVGISQTCKCSGTEVVSNPLDMIKFSDGQRKNGFSSTFCLGIMEEIDRRPFGK